MTTRRDLDLIDHYEGIPAEHRLRALIEGEIAGDDYQQREEELARRLGYKRPEIVRGWTSFRTHVPLDRLPGIAEYLDVSLSVVVALWVSEYAPEQHADTVYNAIKPKVTDAEAQLIDLARHVYAPVDDDDDLGFDI